MKIVSFIAAGAILLGMSAFSLTAAQAAPLGSPDSDALVAGYQIIQFDLQECSAIGGKVSANGNGAVPSDIRDVASKI